LFLCLKSTLAANFQKNSFKKTIKVILVAQNLISPQPENFLGASTFVSLGFDGVAFAGVGFLSTFFSSIDTFA
jgi:hypothetical protein